MGVFRDTLAEHRKISHALTAQTLATRDDMSRLVTQTRKLIGESYDLLATANTLLAKDSWRDRGE